jgi:signal transduction histidine kinase
MRQNNMSAMTAKDLNIRSEQRWYFPRLSGSIETAFRISVVIVFILSILDLIGWIFNITLFKSIMPQWIPMKIITAVCLIFTASALVVIKTNLPVILRKIVARTFAIFIILISLITFYIYLYSLKTGHESSLTEVSYLSFFITPESRMSFLAACNFFLLGCIVFLLMTDKTKSAGITHVLIIPVALASYFVPVSYILGIYSATELADVPVALNSGIAFCGICAAVLLLKPDTWLIRIFTSPDTGGIVARKLLFPLLILPVVIAWLRINGEREGLFNSGEGVVLVALTYTVCFLALVWMTSVSVNKIDKKRHHAEQNLQARTRDLELLNIQLKQELTERIMAQEALRKSESQLLELNATKDKFFNIVAHDLKNPFTSLIGSSELLFRNIDQLDNEKIKTLALILNDSSKSGYAILQNLLDWSRSQTGLLKLNPERINLKNLIDEHILNFEQLSVNKGIKINSEVKEDLFISSDKNMIKTIMRNLLTNAIKYSYRSGKIIVKADVNDRDVRISVKDNGIGIPEENIENIFRIDAKFSVPGTENELGTGLGLKLCKEFAEKLGGRIWVESSENKGSEFKFSVPAGTRQ